MASGWNRKLFLSGVLLLIVLVLCSGDLEPVLQRCCLSGETWARNHTSCTGPPENSLSQDRMACLTSVYICCIRTHRRLNCELGKEAAKEGKTCGQSDTIFADCCSGCSLGLQAGTMRSPCTFSRFSFGSPWDEAYIDCCEGLNPERGTSRQAGRVVCEPNNPCTQKCEVVENHIKCSCYPGFQLAADQASCEDVNECDIGGDTCNPLTERCINIVGGFECKQHPVVDPMKADPCPSGYSMNPHTRLCDDVDECLGDPCPIDQSCVNIKGSYTCENFNSNCQVGFVYSVSTGVCLDVDECGERTDRCNRTVEICQNSHGSYQCIPKPTRSLECPAGFKWNSGICEDFDECQEDLHDCDVDKNCRNTVGGYECDPKCFLLMKFDPVLSKCVESNPCVDNLHNCEDNEVCVPTDEDGLDFICIPKYGTNPCPPGYKPSESNSQSCEDINECEEFPDICDLDRETCVNGKGSYDCIPHDKPSEKDCPSGFRMDETHHCIDVDECLEKLDNCDLFTQDCFNHNGTFQCVPRGSTPRICPPGFSTNPRTNVCEDVNECTEGRQLCLPEEECVNVPGAYTCQPLTESDPCPPGHRFNATAHVCTDVNECLEDTHSCNRITQNCINFVGSYRCVSKTSCPYGYRQTDNKCDDINECSEGTDDCDRRYQICVNTAGSYQCQTKSNRQTKCGSGYMYNLVLDTCRDMDECELFQPCLENQQCENTEGSYHCVCPQGYILDVTTKTCADVNECQIGLHSCAESQRCDNTVGSYTCVRTTSCGTGYTLNAATNQCEDDDECVLNSHNCGPGFSCRNIQGSFRCNRVTCPPGQKLLADGTCKVVACGRGFEPDDAGNCIDVNECARGNPCRLNQQCANSVGSYRCHNLMNCQPGYELNEFGNQCIDIDECERRLYDCGPQQDCRNRPGGYICECPRGYTLNLQRQCEDIDECTRFRGQICSSVSECINTQGSYVCNCKTGFKKAQDGKNCDDIDECAESENICQQTCNNVWGSYQCSCQPGFTLGPDNRSCQDIDECKTHEGYGDLCIGYCVNEPGSYTCSCPHGYRLLSDKITCQDIDECQEQNVCGREEVCLNTRGGFKCNRINCPPNYVRDKDHKNRCKKAVQNCHFDDPVCINEPKTISHNYITFASNLRIPFSGQLDLFTMRGPRLSVTTVQFSLDFKGARAPPGIPAATRQYFHLRRTSYNEAVVSLIQSIQGPQEIELELVLKMFHSGKFAGNAVAKIYIFVTEHKF